MDPDGSKPLFFVGSPHSMLGIQLLLKMVLFESFLGSRKVPKMGPQMDQKRDQKKREREREREKEKEKEKERARERMH